MAIVSSDDAARRLRFVYLGPPSYRWPAATLPAYGLFFGTALAGLVLTFLTKATIGAWLLLEVPPVLLGALLLTKWVFRTIDADTPLAYQLKTIRAEVRTPRPPRPARARATAIPAALFTDHREGR